MRNYFFIYLILCLSTWSCQTQQPKTNIVIFIVDDLGWGDVGYYGSEINTPTIDSLAKTGMILNRFYVGPNCSPTRGALMTGRSPINTGVLIPFEPWHEEGPPLDEKFLPQYLKEAGYQTSAVGKWHLGPNHLKYHPNSRGFDHFFGHLGGFINHYQHTVWRAIDWQRDGETVYDSTYATTMIATEASQIIRARKSENPFFLYVSFNAPHTPLQAPERTISEYSHLQDSSRQIYAAMVTEVDRGIARVIKTLKEEGLTENTLILFMSDNGGAETLARGADNGLLRGGKGTTFEGGIRVPAFFHWQGRIKPNSTFDEMFTVEDILPTILAAAQIPLNSTKKIDGRNMWQTITEGYRSERKEFLLVNHNRKNYNYALFKDQWKLVHMTDRVSGTVQHYLFDILNDPYEKNNLIEQNTEIAENMIDTFDSLPKAKIININAAPPPKGPGGPGDAIPDNRPPINKPYTETVIK